MGIVVPETCWASNKTCNKNHLLHLVGILFPHMYLSMFASIELLVRYCSIPWCTCVNVYHGCDRIWSLHCTWRIRRSLGTWSTSCRSHQPSRLYLSPRLSSSSQVCTVNVTAFITDYFGEKDVCYSLICL